jgi:hypothetical protein
LCPLIAHACFARATRYTIHLRSFRQVGNCTAQRFICRACPEVFTLEPDNLAAVLFNYVTLATAITQYTIFTPLSLEFNCNAIPRVSECMLCQEEQ